MPHIYQLPARRLRCLMPRMTFVGLCGQIPSRIRKCLYQVPPPRTICAYLRILGPTLVSSCVRARAARAETDGEMMHLAAKAREKERRGLPINDWSMGQCIPVGTALIHNVIWFSSSRCVWRTRFIPRFFQNFWIPVSRLQILTLESHSLPAI